MKKLFTFVFALAAFVAANAQADFTVGENVAAKLGLGDVDGSFSGSYEANSNGDNDVKSIGNYWKGTTPVEYHANGGENDPGIIGFYNVDDVNIYQIVKVPAGSYTFKAQALYREGTPQDNFKNHFSGKFTKYGHMYASFVSDAEGTNVVRNFDRVLRTLATAEQNEAIFFDSDGSWKNDAEYKVETGVDEEGNKTYISYYCPCCLPGLAAYFAAGKYENELNFVCTADTYVKFGFKKTGSIKQDWLPFTNVRVIYNGPADEQAQIALAKEECQNSLAELEEVQQKVTDAGFNGLAGAIGDLVMDYRDAADEKDAKLDDLTKLLEKINTAVANYTKSLSHVNTLADLLNMSSDMLASTSFPGLADFQTAYDKAKKDSETDDVAALGDDPGKYYDEVYNVLSKARADYLNSQEPNEKGAKDFTALIKSPWFVNPENTPIKNNDGNWELQNAPEWNVWEGPDAYSKRVTSRPDIASKVDVATDATVTNQWYKYFGYTSGWCAGIDMMSGSHLVSMSTGWSSGFVGEAGVRQQLVGLPNGYYSVNCLVKGWDACSTWTTNPKILGCMAQNSEEVAVYSVPSENTGNWWSWGWDWDDVQTSIISISDGRLLIGGGGSISNQITGFRLSFYGEQPNFDEMIGDKLDYLSKQISEGNISFAGDLAAIKEFTDQVTRPITDANAYEAALVPISGAQNYIDKAKAAMKNYTAFETMVNLMEYDFTEPASNYISNFGDSNNDTYEKVDELNAIANAYKSYCETYDKATAVNDATIAGIVAKQTASMKANIKTVDEINAYLEEIALPYNIALMASKGAANATEAAPVNLTDFIINPEFTNNPTGGWSGETPTNNEYAFDTDGNKVNAELWNKSAFTLSQTIKGLPAGTYELRVKAIYRDGGSVTQDLVDAYNAAGSEETWANHNAQVFMKASDENDQFSYIKAIESLKYTENSFTEVATAYDKEDMEDGSVSVFPTKAVAIAGTTKTINCDYGDDAAEGAYPFDTKVGDYYYPASMQGFLQVCKKHPADVANKVQITIATGDNIELGLRKTAAIGSDWVIFDSFELYYLTGDEFKKAAATDIQNVTVEATDAASYNVAGQRVANNYKGIVIKNGKKFMNK